VKLIQDPGALNILVLQAKSLHLPAHTSGVLLFCKICNLAESGDMI
jgi:hypothetical protein